MKLWTIFFITIFNPSCWPMESTLEKKGDSCLGPSIQYVGLDKEQGNFIDNCLDSINSYERGKQLIEFITGKLTENKCSVQVKAGNKQVFKTPKEGRPFTLFLNFNEVTKERYMGTPCLGLISDNKFIPIGGSIVPFHIVLGHELLHIKHYLEDKTQYDIDSASVNNSYWPIYDDTGYRLGNLWHDLEEQRTVIGRMDNPETCELTLRAQYEIAPRYAYQDLKDHFYEDKSIIENILSVHGIKDASKLTRDDWIFNEGVALNSRLNSETYKKQYPDLYKEVGEELKNEVKTFNKDQLMRKEAMLKKLAERGKKK